MTLPRENGVRAMVADNGRHRRHSAAGPICNRDIDGVLLRALGRPRTHHCFLH